MEFTIKAFFYNSKHCKIVFGLILSDIVIYPENDMEVGVLTNDVTEHLQRFA